MTFWSQKFENGSHENFKMVAVRNVNKHGQNFQNCNYEERKQTTGNFRVTGVKTQSNRKCNATLNKLVAAKIWLFKEIVI